MSGPVREARPQWRKLPSATEYHAGEARRPGLPRLKTAIVALPVSALLLVPCFWQSRIQAGDLSSHIYNAWLAILIEQGKVEGLYLARQWTNVLFDIILTELFKAFGPEAAQRIAVSAAVLVFAWGAFFLLSVVAARRPWFLMPSVAILAYGWVFHMGFFNYYLSLGLCLWGLSLLWRPAGRRMLPALSLAAIAWVAHALPVLWLGGATTYVWIARRLSIKARLALLGVAAAALLAIRELLVTQYSTAGGFYQIFYLTGADQAWVYGTPFLLISGWWIWILVGVFSREGLQSSVSHPAFQLCALTALSVVLIPTRIELPMYPHPLTFIAERMSLVAAVTLALLLARAIIQAGGYEPEAAARAYHYWFRSGRCVFRVPLRREPDAEPAGRSDAGIGCRDSRLSAGGGGAVLWRRPHRAARAYRGPGLYREVL